MSQLKTILITGASGGIGSALVKQYASQDQAKRLILLGRNKNKLESVAAQYENLNTEITTHGIDIRNSSEIQLLVESIDKQNPIDLIICNAGVTSNIGDNGEAESWEAISQVIDVNLYGVLASLNPLISHMQQRKQGQIALVSSLAAYRGMPITPAYCASKAAVKAYGEALRGWLSTDGIKVNVICPGFVESDMSKQFPGDKPLMISADKAAIKIIKGLNRNKACISFPFPLNTGMWLLSILPYGIADWFMRLFSYGGKRCGKQGGKQGHKRGANH